MPDDPTTGQATGTSSAEAVGEALFDAVGLADSPSGADGRSIPRVSADLPRAIVDRFNATPELDWVVGGLTLGLAQTDADTYAEFHWIAEPDPQFTTCTDYVRRVVYQFNCYAPGAHDAERMMEALVSAFNHKMVRLVYERGTSTLVVPGQSLGDEEEFPSPAGFRLRRQHCDFAFTVNESLP